MNESFTDQYFLMPYRDKDFWHTPLGPTEDWETRVISSKLSGLQSDTRDCDCT